MTHIRNKSTRRADLLNAAREIFAERGYEATTVSEVVSRAGVAQGTFYLYFPSKMHLVLALSQEMQEQIEFAIREAYTQTEDLNELIEKSVRATFHTMWQYRDVLSVMHTGAHWVDAPAERERTVAPYYALIAELIRQEQERGNVAANINPPITAKLIVGLVYYAVDECYLYHSTEEPEAYISETIRFIRQALAT